MKKKTFGTLAGVFTPTTLTILGVIMYIRQPWVVGNAGIVGAIGILLLAVVITFATALSISTITTNVKIGAGGAFSVISQSLGLEIGGAIGIPFYIAQAIAVAMYIFGFREGLQTLLPLFNPLFLDAAIFTLVMVIAFISTSFAFKIQYVILFIIVLSLISIYGGLFTNELNYDFQLFGNYEGSPENNFQGTSFWIVFAVFFPAVTGVMAGANMSGDLTDPKKSIPSGTISSVIITTIIYFSLIFVASLLATKEELLTNYNVFIDKSLFPPIVLAGLLGATLSSALGSFVGAPRILSALAEKRILPKSNFIAKLSKKGEPINAMLLTAIVVLIGISLRDLNTIAPLLTMFFMITYAMVNVVALVEQSLGLPSFRPSLKIPLIVPIIGATGSITVMFIINAIVALLAVILILFFYFYLVRMNIKSTAGDSRSGLFTALAEWATNKTTELNPKKEARSWRPDLLLPIQYPREIRSSFKLIESIVYPKGSIKILSLKHENEAEKKRLQDFLPLVEKKFKEIKIPISKTSIDNKNFNDATNISMQALNAAFFKPNTVLITIDSNTTDYSKYKQLIEDVRANEYGLIFYIPFGTASLAIQKNISLWVHNLPENWDTAFDLGINDLAILIAIQISKNWKGSIDINFLESSNLKISQDVLFKEMVRFNKNTTCRILSNDLMRAIEQETNSDLNVLSISTELTIENMVEMVKRSRISAIFCLDSGNENALV
jgi:amino acid transporter